MYTLLLILVSLFGFSVSFPYDEAQIPWNINVNPDASTPLDYFASWENHTYHPSPDNWRFPFYSFMVDRFVNGDPTNDDINGTAWEHDIYGTQLRAGGDIQGLVDSLDYLAGMGIRGLYLVGSPMINLPWGTDQFSPLDHTVLDHHLGNLSTWRSAIEAIHDHGMYVLLENTMSTLGDLIGFEGYLNASARWSFEEHNALWKEGRRYADWDHGNTWLEKCDTPYPRFWKQTGYRYDNNDTDAMVGCRDSEFDQYGELGAFEEAAEWRKQLSKFGGVQDRLREWKPSVREKIEHFSCMMIAALDIDGFRMDKGMQITVDAQGNFSAAMRACARRYDKENFFIPGEIVNGNADGAIYIGLGKEPEMAFDTIEAAFRIGTDRSNSTANTIRTGTQHAFDSAAFHYSIYRGLLRFLGLDGRLTSKDTSVNFAEAWNEIVLSNDMSNAMNGKFDPRHLFGVESHDVFRWSGFENGWERHGLGAFIVTLTMPGMPLLSWGEEQAFHTLDSTAANYVYGRQFMASASAWKTHGCYKVGYEKLNNAPFNSSLYACQDDSVSLDHRDMSHEKYNIFKMMFEMRSRYPALNDGWIMRQLSNITYNYTLPGSFGTPTETGLYSVFRARFPELQDFSDVGQGNVNVWLLYSNENKSRTFEASCDSDAAIIAPFGAGTRVRNLFYPFEEYALQESSSPENFSCVSSSVEMNAYGFKALVPTENWMNPSPHVTKFSPGHDARLFSQTEQDIVPISIEFSHQMDCQSIAQGLSVSSSTGRGNAVLNQSSVECFSGEYDVDRLLTGAMPSNFTFSADLINVWDGVHTVSFTNASAATLWNGTTPLLSSAKFMFRIGQEDNPMVFPSSANYSSTLLFKNSRGLYINNKAAGADLFRYSTNWGSSWSSWLPYQGGNITIERQPWSGTSKQEWHGEHVKVQYWSKATGSSNHLQEGDLHEPDSSKPPRRWPHAFAEGSWNQYGFDAGYPNEMHQDDDGLWNYHLMTEWPTSFQVNVWGVNPDGQPDRTQAFGDVDNDTVLDRIPPASLERAVVNMTDDNCREMGPPSPYLAWRILVNDGDMRFMMVPVGSRWAQLVMFILLAVIPLTTAVVAVMVYRAAFYKVKFNQVGLAEKRQFISAARMMHASAGWLKEKFPFWNDKVVPFWNEKFTAREDEPASLASSVVIGPDSDGFGLQQPRRTVLIATMEYFLDDWNIKIKIGGLGVMAQLMGQNLQEQDLIWVVPCVGGIDYPVDTPTEPMIVQIMGKPYEVKVQYHKLNNITYVLLDAPIFRQQTKADPYPARMDDLESAVYYSAWNQCIAEAIKRFPIDLYHINDYHGTLAPLYLLPDRMIPCCLSLHNAEFQGLWPCRTPKERQEICEVFNLPMAVAQNYVQFGEVFNLLHAGASILRIHQDGFGAVGVSTKYGKRSFARYPIFWGLKKVGALSNPDPSDLDDWDKRFNDPKLTVVDQEFEDRRAGLKRQAQEWAGLEQRPDADLFVFVGRWSLQKGVDLIADVFPAILEKYKHAQLLCVGPVIDLYGRFAALKLQKMMETYPGRVKSIPEFTALPPYVFSGAEFALIPSRDEPFGLVAVEFGRKGALGVGARVGGLGHVPGWWYTVESMTTKHLIHQFKDAIQQALKSSQDIRAKMRARSAKTRFPVQQWKEDLEILQSGSIRAYERQQSLKSGPRAPWNRLGGIFLKSPSSSSLALDRGSGWLFNGWNTPAMIRSPQNSTSTTRKSSPTRDSGPRSWSLRSESGRDLRQSRLGTSSRARSPESTRSMPVADTPPRSSLRYGSASAPSSKAVSRDASPDSVKQRSSHSRVSFDMAYLPDRSHRTPGTRLSTIIDDREAIASPTGQGPDESPSSAILPANEAKLMKQLAKIRSHGPEAEVVPPPPAYFWSHDSDTRGLGGSVPDTPALGTPGGGSFGDSEGDISTLVPGTPDARPLFLGSAARSGTQTPRSTAGDSSLPPLPIDQRQLELSLQKVLDNKKDKTPQDLIPSFTDPTGQYYREFEAKLANLSGKTSEGSLCIEEYLMNSEKHWFNRHYKARMTPLASSTATPEASIHEQTLEEEPSDDDIGQFLVPDDYKPPTGVKRLLNTKLFNGDWPLYAFLLALGQILAANSYQIVLLTGQNGQPAARLYSIAGIYLASTIAWWCVFRRFKCLYVISLPWLFYGLAFFFLGVSPYGRTIFARGWIQNVAVGLYAVGASAGSFFFAQNFGSQGAQPVKTWGFRACAIQGTQQIYIVALWYWGSVINARSNNGLTSSLTDWRMTAITTPIAILFWSIGVLLFLGLPEFYRQSPGAVPSFYTSIFRRRIIIWFLIAVALQTYFLSAPYGRNWTYLWSSKHAPAWCIVVLIVFFFIVLWAAALFFFAHESVTHSWILPIFAVGLGAPRWCQMLWATSNIGSYLPWAGGSIASALLGRALWLWLGVLDALQGVGFGMILLQTLTRFHLTFALAAGQVVGSLFTILARATASDKIGPGDVFPDFSAGREGLTKAWFWVALGAQAIVCLGFFKFFRKEQLSKP